MVEETIFREIQEAEEISVMPSEWFRHSEWFMEEQERQQEEQEHQQEKRSTAIIMILILMLYAAEMVCTYVWGP